MGVRIAALALLFAAPATAQQAPLPWQDAEVAVEAEALVVHRLGRPDPRIGDWSARRLSARRRGKARALEALHRYVDDALARVHAAPTVARRVHRLVDREAEVAALRPLADGAAILRVTLARSALRSVASREGLPW